MTRVSALAGLEEIALEFREGRRSYLFSVPGPAAASDAVAEIRVNEGLGSGQVRKAGGLFPFRLEAGDAVEIVVLRDGERLTLTAVLGDRR